MLFNARGYRIEHTAARIYLLASIKAQGDGYLDGIMFRFEVHHEVLHVEDQR
jgi:hypothetical protein